MTVVEVSPIVKSIDVRRSAREAFRVFTEEISAWWPMHTHNRGVAAKGEIAVRVTVEPRVGGRIYETLQDGRDLEWGVVKAFEPGALFAMEWSLGRPQSTDVSVRFEPLDADSCRVTLTHENWERMGEEADKLRNAYNNGWVAVFENGFGAYAGLKQ
ncbi:MAG TPA: hypothetical protein VEA80_18035 [Vitreimonas sp.]|uniref:hypothetical protein n=1 Tax=Vitreimonas sp. TaxID=3069702 RepID=UPI002D3B1DFF|nr:hypothetical protein [Vitreimonas sp.]HYD89384.1 hypothetical protein [Vitreimonas sp.]